MTTLLTGESVIDPNFFFHQIHKIRLLLMHHFKILTKLLLRWPLVTGLIKAGGSVSVPHAAQIPHNITHTFSEDISCTVPS